MNRTPSMEQPMARDADGTAARLDRGRLIKYVAAAAIGNALEWYDLAIYGFLALTIARVFFPTQSQTTSLLLSFGTFGASYFMRPLGALYLGAYADRHGRRAGMTLTVWLMGLGTLLIAVAPSYAAVGIGAPLLVVGAKFLQGFSAGGEFGTSVSFLVEHAGHEQRGLLTSFQIVGVGLATALASSVGFALNHYFSAAQIVAWAWRLPFFLGLLIAPLGWYIRRRVDETPAFARRSAQAQTSSPVADIWNNAKMRIACAVGVYCLAASTNYILSVYIPTYAIRELGIPAQYAFWGAMGFALVQIFVAPLIGHLSDRYGRMRFIVAGTILVTLTVIPTFQLMLAWRTPTALVACVVGLGILVTVFQGSIPAFLSELFPTATRTTGLAIIHNLNFTLFGGFAPMVTTSLIHLTGDRLVPAYYMLATAAFAVVSLVYFAVQARRAREVFT